MHVVSFRRLREYFLKEPNAKGALKEWFKKTKNAEWKSFSDLKNTFNSADSVGNKRYVINIKGNHYRVVVIILFRIQRVYIRWVGRHKDYNELKSINTL
ncbi:MAG: type II toxin-antitoxin system HigB family toxin [Flavobacteriaceae bacterium]|nr:type II toxin-antitoxin system HigB family toxin [Flavobacteriaceae bacterium]MCY4266719.1 type II toxin-antitoxin system HigB family toxin [Flavobacteriaceae bacterium]